MERCLGNRPWEKKVIEKLNECDILYVLFKKQQPVCVFQIHRMCLEE